MALALTTITTIGKTVVQVTQTGDEVEALVFAQATEPGRFIRVTTHDGRTIRLNPDNIDSIWEAS
jgi:hypothetical protein